MAPPKLTSISPALDPRAIEHFNPPARDGPDAMIEHMASAVATAQKAAVSALDIAMALKADINLPDAAKHRRVRDDCRSAIARGLTAIDAAMQRYVTESERIRATISAPPKPTLVPDLMIMQAIMNRLPAMKPADRKQAFAAALAKGDTTTLSAILHAPQILTGMSDGEIRMMQASYAKANFPAEVEKLARWGKASDALVRAHRAADGLVNGMFNQMLAEQADASAQRTEAALARARAH
jgi:hypothetical protein